MDNAGNISTHNTQVTYYWSGQAPPKPNNLAVTPPAGDSNSFTISWDKPSQGPGESPIIGYYYSINAVPTILNTTYIASTDIHVSVGPDHFATQQGENTVYVSSRNEAGIGSFLPEYYATATFSCNTIAPPIPVSVSIYDSSNKALSLFSLSLNWLAGAGQNPATFAHYLIERSTNGTDYSQLATSVNTSYIDTGLSDATTYYYRLKAVDNANATSASSSVVSLKPSGKYDTPPTLLAAPNVSAKYSEATITWLTDRVSTSFVRYSTNPSSLNESKGQDEYVTSHSVTLKGLRPNTLYYYQTQSADQNRNYPLDQAYSSTYTFMTAQQPAVSNVQTSNITLYSADVSWETTTLTTSSLNYGTTSSYGTVITDVSPSASTKHSVRISSLEPATTYHFKITASDADGSELSSDDYSFSTLPLPEITSVKIASVEGAVTQTVKVTWSTNVDVSSIVKYSSADEQPREKTSAKLEKEHQMEIVGLLDNQSYIFVVSGKDAYGNIAEAKSATFATPYDTRPPKITDITVETSNIGASVEDKAQIIISFKTDEPAKILIEYGPGMSGDYNRQAKDEGLKIEHTNIITGLDELKTYHFKITVEDKSGNKDSSLDNVVTTQKVRHSALAILLQIFQKLFGWMKI